MNIQIFGKSKSFDTKKAERWFKERRIKYQYIDLATKGLSAGEYRSVRAAVGYDALVDRDCIDYRELGIDYLLPQAAEEKLLEYQLHIVVFQQLLILLHQCVFRLGEDLYQIIPAQTVEGHHHRHTAHQLRDDAEFQQVVGLDLAHRHAADDGGGALTARVAAGIGQHGDVGRQHRCLLYTSPSPRDTR